MTRLASSVHATHAARALGAGLARHLATRELDGRVHSVFARAVNVEWNEPAGALLRHVRHHSKQNFRSMVGVDIVAPANPIGDGIEFVSGWVESLPFPDKSFDTVICTHVIEHILDYRNAIAELRRIARKQLIIVVPRERESIYTFNPHFNFFPYSHSFLRAMIPVPATHVCEDVGRDIYYREDLTAAVAKAA